MEHPVYRVTDFKRVGPFTLRVAFEDGTTSMFSALLARIASTFETRRIPYMVIGDAAVPYGEPRLNHAIDITPGVKQFKELEAQVRPT